MGSKRQDSSATEWREFRIAEEEPPRVIPLGRPIPTEARVVREEPRNKRPLGGLVGDPPPQFSSNQINSSSPHSYPSNSYPSNSHPSNSHPSNSYSSSNYQGSPGGAYHTDPYRIPNGAGQHTKPYPLQPKPLVEARRDPRLAGDPSYYPAVYQDSRSLESRYGIPALPEYLTERRPARSLIPSIFSEISPFRLAAGLLFLVSSIFLAVTLATLIDLSIKRSSEGAGRTPLVAGR